jgi:hypothetical protein
MVRECDVPAATWMMRLRVAELGSMERQGRSEALDEGCAARRLAEAIISRRFDIISRSKQRNLIAEFLTRANLGDPVD